MIPFRSHGTDSRGTNAHGADSRSANAQPLDHLITRISARFGPTPEQFGKEFIYLPNRERILDILHIVRDLLFPGYFSRELLNTGNVCFYVGNQVLRVQEMLTAEIFRALYYTRDRLTTEEVEDETRFRISCQRRAEQVTSYFLNQIPRLQDLLVEDVRAALRGDPAATSDNEIIMSYPGLMAITVHRVAHLLYHSQVPLLPRVMSEYAHAVTGIDIHPGADIGHSFFIDHGTGVVIGETTVIGNYAKIYQGVTLGALSTRDAQGLHNVKRHPTLGDFVTVYSGATILGGNTVIGDHVTIGSNVFITSSVTERTRVSPVVPCQTAKQIESKRTGRCGQVRANGPESGHQRRRANNEIDPATRKAMM